MVRFNRRAALRAEDIKYGHTCYFGSDMHPTEIISQFTSLISGRLRRMVNSLLIVAVTA